MLLSLPDYRQENGHDCGRVCLRLLTHYWGRSLPNSLADLSNPYAGTSPDCMWAALLAMGFKVISGNWTVSLLKAVTSDGKPVACLIQYEGTGHWVVVRGVTKTRCHFNCPVRGVVSQPIAEWSENWRDSHWSGSTFLQWGLSPFLED